MKQFLFRFPSVVNLYRPEAFAVLLSKTKTNGSKFKLPEQSRSVVWAEHLTAPSWAVRLKLNSPDRLNKHVQGLAMRRSYGYYPSDHRKRPAQVG